MKKASYINLFIMLVLSDISYAAFQTPTNPNSAKECAICHYRWIDTFFIDGKGSDLVEYSSEKVAASPGMCFSCHDGSVRDSRARLNNSSGHKVNLAPPAEMEIPKLFPLDESGRMQCATCHTAHGVPSGPGTDTTIFMRTSNKDSAMCRMCHPNMDGGIVSGNHPLGRTKQKIPTKFIGHGSATSKEKENQMICETCHTAHGSPYENLLIDNDRNSELCLGCHLDKNIFTADGKKKPSHIINVIPKNVKIPEKIIAEGAKFGRGQEIICETCHKVHKNKVEKQLLLIKKDEKSTLCLTCHQDKQHLSETKHNLIQSAPKEKNLDGKTAGEAGICSPCHLPHKAARKFSGEKDYKIELCLSCHSKGNLAEKVNFRGMIHPLDVNPFKYKKSGIVFSPVDVDSKDLELPLYNKFGAQDKNGEMTCSTCHDAHALPLHPKNVEAGKDMNGDSVKPVSFLRSPPSEICGKCHHNKFLIANSKHDLMKSAPEAKNILNQTPAESGLCGSCHRVHGPEEEGHLWTKDALVKGEAPEQNSCEGCHNESGIAKKKINMGYSHPINISPLEKGIGTSLPLFDKNGKYSESGLMTCRTCHDPHRWDPLNTYTDDHFSAEGDAQNSFLRFENSPSPGLCVNCHSDKASVEKTDHDLMITAPSSKNIIDQTPLESGVCGVCHLVHNSKNKIVLWARKPGNGESIMEKMCDGCHTKNGSASSKKPLIASHPEDKLIVIMKDDSTDNLNHFPLFDETSGERISVGNISCPSCHDAHQWDPDGEKGKGMNMEGDPTNSFLRAKVESLPCKDCHGTDALMKYLYFHDPKKRTKKNLQDLD